MLAGGEATLTVLVVALLTATIVDLKWHKIPNLLCVCLALYGLAAHLYVGLGVIQPILGIAMGLVIFLPFYVGGGMGAGDVKFMSAIGAILGTKIFLAAGMTLIAGAIVALLVVLSQATGRSALKSYASALISYVRSGVWSMDEPLVDAHRYKRFPYSLAIGLGTLTSLVFTI